jgi:hypothetical protein
VTIARSVTQWLVGVSRRCLVPVGLRHERPRSAAHERARVSDLESIPRERWARWAGLFMGSPVRVDIRVRHRPYGRAFVALGRRMRCLAPPFRGAKRDASISRSANDESIRVLLSALDAPGSAGRDGA